MKGTNISEEKEGKVFCSDLEQTNLSTVSVFERFKTI